MLKMCSQKRGISIGDFLISKIVKNCSDVSTGQAAAAALVRYRGGLGPVFAISFPVERSKDRVISFPNYGIEYIYTNIHITSKQIQI